VRFTETKLKGAYIIELEPIHDDRGFFARSWCQNEFRDRGLNPNLVQCNISFNLEKGTLRGMHYQVKPHEEAKLVRCTRGAIYDVIIDIRPESATFTQWMAVELSAENYKMLYVPKGFAHGFQTLENNTEVFYQMSDFYRPESARGIRWDDSVFAIVWALTDGLIISLKDRQYPSFDRL
jgi:dTDP-4-dehydrorhamnose 3,5-epimerase